MRLYNLIQLNKQLHCSVFSLLYESQYKIHRIDPQPRAGSVLVYKLIVEVCSVSYENLLNYTD